MQGGGLYTYPARRGLYTYPARRGRRTYPARSTNQEAPHDRDEWIVADPRVAPALAGR